MADRFPLIVNSVSKKIEELVAGDNLELTGNGIIVAGDVGAEGQFLRSDGAVVGWAYSGDVFTTGVQNISDKILSNCSISGSENTLTNIANASLQNSSLTVNGLTVALGGSIVIPDTNTTYAISAVDGATAARKILRLTSGGTSTPTNQDITLVAGSNVTLARSGSDITITSSYVDTNTITTLRSSVGGNATSGDITLAAGASGNTTITQSSDGLTLTIDSVDTDTITRLRGGTGENLLAGDFTLIGGTEVTLSQTGRDITINSSDTITRLKGGTTGSFVSGDITFVGGSSGNTTVSQNQGTITIDSTDTNTVTRIKGTSGGTFVTGDVTILGSGDTTVEQSGNVITISTNDQDTTYTAAASGGLFLDGTEFSIKNSQSLSDQTVSKWDSTNAQYTNTIITDDGSTVTISGDLIVSGTSTTIDTQNLVVADNTIELRKGNSLTGSDGGIQLNRTTDSNGVVQTFNTLQWFESGGYWRTWDGSVPHRLVTVDETQTLTNKTLTSPTLTFPNIGAATATSINGLGITSTVSATLGVTNAKTVNFTNSINFNTDNDDAAITAEMRLGGTVAYSSDTLAFFASTTSNQLRGLISDSTGSSKAVFSENPTFLTSVKTDSNSFAVFNTTVVDVDAFGAATSITMGATSGTTEIRNSLQVNQNVILSDDVGDTVTVNGTATFLNADITVRGEGNTTEIKIGKGGNSIATNTRVGYRALESNTTGNQNTAFGYESSFILNEGSSNTSFGYQALREAGTGQENTVIGASSGDSITSGSRNTAVGMSTGASLTDQDGNVFIGYAAGAANTGSGNVLIGAATTGDTLSASYAGPNPSGDNQLVISSGTGTWIRGDANYDVTLPNNLTVQKSLVISGDLTVNGTTTTINTRTLSIDDKAIELGAVATINFQGDATLNSNTITNISSTAGFIVGMEVQVLSVGITLPAGTTIQSIGTNQITLTGNIGDSGGTGVTFTAVGPNEDSANGGGIIVKGGAGTANDKTFLYDNTGLFNFWDSSESINLASGKVISVNETIVLSSTTLGDTVVNSSLTSVGTLSGLSANGNISLKGRVIEKVVNNFSTSIDPVAFELEVDASNGNTIVGTLGATSRIDVWNFTNLGLTNGSSITLTLIVDGNPVAIYGDDCKVEGTTVLGGIQWSGGSPPANTSNTDILTFIVVQDGSGVIRVYGQGNTDFS